MILSGDPGAREALMRAVRPHLGWDGRPAERIRDLEEILDSGTDESFPGILVPLIVPDPDGDYVGFYAAADDLTQWRALQPLLMAALGSTLTTFDGRQLRRTSDAPMERLLKDAGLVLARFRAAPGTKLERRPSGLVCPRHPTTNQRGSRCAQCNRQHGRLAIDAARRIRRQAAAAPVFATVDARSASRLLYEFDMALLARDQEVAEALVEELKERRLLDTLNLHFLHVHLDAEFEEWDRLAAREWFEHLCHTRRPAAVTSALAEAATRAFLTVHPGVAAAELVTRFRADALPRAGSLFARTPEQFTPLAATGFLLGALATHDASGVADMRSVSTEGWPTDERERFEALLALAPSNTPAAAPGESSGSVVDLQAIEELLTAPGELDLPRLLASLQELSASGTLAAGRLEQEVTQRLVDSDIDAALAGDDALSSAPVVPIPQSWIEWFRTFPGLDFATARNIAEQASREWAVSGQLRSRDDVDALIAALEEAISGPDASRALVAVPHLVEWLESDTQWPNADLADVYEGVLSALLTSGIQSASTLRTALALLEGLLVVGLAPGVYARHIDDVRETLRDAASVATLDPTLDAAELTLAYPCGDPNARLALWVEVTAILRRFAPQLSARQFEVASTLAESFGTPDALPPAPVADANDQGHDSSWSGLVGIYSLRGMVAHHVQAALERLYPDVRVERREDEVATDGLRSLAERAHVMATDWSASKHAATNAVRATAGDRLLWVNGGASSMLARIQQRIAVLARNHSG